MALALPPAADELLDRFGGPRRAGIAAVGLLTVLLILGLSRWATAPTYVPVFSDLPLETVGKVTAKLDETNIPYRLENGGTELRVAASELARVRVLLAGDGLPTAGRPGLELFDQPSWGMTDFAQRINYRRALEGELERTIGKMSGVASAQVHLAMEQSRPFQKESQPEEASVVLKLRSGAQPGQDVVTGIQHLVSSSVDGLQAANVTVLDEAGRMLSSPIDPSSPAGLTSRQLEMQREVEGHLEGKAQQLVDEVIGVGAARVKVAAEINFDHVERTVQKVDPDAQVIASEQKAQIIPGPQGGAGSNNTATTYENSRTMESYTGATGNVKRLTVAVVVNDRRVAAGDSVRYEARTPQELAQVEALVRNAVGVDTLRGDAISVVSMRFSEPPSAEPEPAPGVLGLASEYRSELVTVIALLLAAFVALRVVKTLGATAPGAAAAPAQLAAGASPDALPAGAGDGDAAEREPVAAAPRFESPNARARHDVISSVRDQPDVAARLVRVWLKEA